MITVFGEGRGFRVVWLLEERGLPYRLRPVDLIAGVEDEDSDVTMVESIAIMEYLLARYGPTPVALDPHDPAFPAYQQFLHLGEAGPAAFHLLRRRQLQYGARVRAAESGAPARRWKCSIAGWGW